MKRSETRKLPNGMLAHRYQIIGTDIVIHQAYEPTLPTATRCDGLVLGHTTMSKFEGHAGWYGRVGTRRPTKELKATRENACKASRIREYQEMQNNLAGDAIIQAFPYCNYRSCRDGEIVTNVTEVERAEAQAA
jgi:hypothetical protein